MNLVLFCPRTLGVDPEFGGDHAEIPACCRIKAHFNSHHATSSLPHDHHWLWKRRQWPSETCNGSSSNWSDRSIGASIDHTMDRASRGPPEDVAVHALPTALLPRERGGISVRVSGSGKVDVVCWRPGGDFPIKENYLIKNILEKVDKHDENSSENKANRLMIFLCFIVIGTNETKLKLNQGHFL